MAVIILVPIIIAEAVTISVGAAALAGRAVAGSFSAHDGNLPPGGPLGELGHGPQLPQPRNVTTGEENLAKRIADELDSKAEIIEEYAQHVTGEDQPMQQQSAEAHAMRGAAIQYRTITAAMLATTAATIAAPGVAVVKSAQAHVQAKVWAIVPGGLTATVTDAQNLLVSLATPTGTA